MNGQDTYSSKSIKWDDIPEKDYFQNNYDVIDTRNERLGLDNNYGIKKENITIKDTWEAQKIQYKNRLIDNPIRIGADGAGVTSFTDTGVYGSPGCFTGKSKEEKMRMTGLLGHACNPNAGEWTKSQGLIVKADFPHCPNGTVENHSEVVNKYAEADIRAIFQEICNLGWFRAKFSNCFRSTTILKSGWSWHCGGVAVDINPNLGCPYFNYRFGPNTTEPAAGSPAPAGNKPGYSFKIPSGYDRTCCIWSADHPVVQIFRAHGWGWGGKYGDTMHFSIIDGN